MTVLRRSLIALALVLAFLLALAGGAFVVLTHSSTVGVWLLSRVPGMQVSGVQGRVFGGPFAVERVTFAGAREVVVEQLAWKDLQWRWRPHAGSWLALDIDRASAARVRIGVAASATPMQAPVSLRLPIDLAFDGVQVGELRFEDRTVLVGAQARRLELGAESGARHRIDGLQVALSRAAVEASASIASDAPFALSAHARLTARDSERPWQGQIDAAGEFAALRVAARLTSARAAGAALDAKATLAPFAAWPVAALELVLSDLDLAALGADLPRTRLSGRADITTRASDAPIDIRVALANAEPGRWDGGRLPIATLDAELGASAQARERIDVKRFDARLVGDAGRIEGRGQWQGGEAELALTLADVRPQLLHASAMPMRLGGQLTLRAAGLPAPDGSRPAAAVQTAQAVLALDGRVDAARALRVAATTSLRREGAAWQLEAKPIEVGAGAARLTAQASASGQRGGAWQLTTEGQASAFDPAPWWRLPFGALPAGTHELNGRWQAELQVPAGARALPRDSAAALAVRGAATVELAPSRVAGVALQGRLALDGRTPGWGVVAALQAAGNSVRIDGRLQPRASDDRWKVELQAPALAALQPLARALPPSLAPIVPTQGQLDGQVQASGRWPATALQGQLKGSALQAARGRVAAITLQGQAGPDANAPLALHVDAQQLALANAPRFEVLAARIDGTLAQHRATIDAVTALRPPAWTDRLTGTPGGANGEAKSGTSGGSRLRLAGAGGWADNTWRARGVEFDWRSTANPQAPAWLQVRDLQATLRLDADRRPREAFAEPGRALVLGAPLVWRAARWRAQAGQPAAFELDATLEPTPAAPWLQRLWPQAGLAGDLALQAQLKVKAADTFAADLVLERARGDLAYRDEDGSAQPFGLTDLRLALSADAGTWHFTQAVAGSNVGVLAGAQSMRIAPSARWPAQDTPMQGVLEWRVADLGAWARFTPPGWRVAGTLRTSASLGGRFGAPEVEGEMVGSGLAVRHLLHGVDVRDGELALSLRGANARIERFVFKGGDGTLRLSGGATLGAEPSAQLQLDAERFRLLGRVDRRLVASGSAQLRLAANALALEGKFRADEGLFDLSHGDAPSLDADVRVHGGRWGAKTPDDATPAPTARPSGAPRDLRVALAIDLGRDLKLRGRGLDARLGGQLNVTAPGGRLAVNGSVRADSGQYAAYGQQLEIERGVLTFNGTVENPRLDIFAVRPNLDVKVGVLVSGTAQLPRVRLVSEPEMSQFDKLSWLLLGRASDGLARTDTALLQRAALALLAGEGQTPDAALMATLGLDEFSVRQTDNGEVRDTVVTLGKQLSRRWYVGYERGVNSTTGTWQLIYRIAQRFTLRAQSGQDNALDAIWTWRWN
ncbi:MAG TPA: translocation/assembly module TamB domain-containing protein [Burkholderiaceae bacterium]|nr:translocation/assembly module TamB domain-containing protein [Burkholderiaceae bacterium]